MILRIHSHHPDSMLRQAWNDGYALGRRHAWVAGFAAGLCAGGLFMLAVLGTIRLVETLL